MINGFSRTRETGGDGCRQQNERPAPHLDPPWRGTKLIPDHLPVTCKVFVQVRQLHQAWVMIVGRRSYPNPPGGKCGPQTTPDATTRSTPLYSLPFMAHLRRVAIRLVDTTESGSKVVLMLVTTSYPRNSEMSSASGSCTLSGVGVVPPAGWATIRPEAASCTSRIHTGTGCRRPPGDRR